MNLFSVSYLRILFFLSLISHLTSHISLSQNTTYSPDDKKKVTKNPEVKDNRKVLIIPFEPKLYNSEIDKNVYKESKLNFNQIRYAFRSGLDYWVTAEFKKKYSVISMLNDTSKSRADQQYIYESIGYKYEPIPGPDGKMEKDKTENSPKVQNGQLTVATNDQEKFMNTKITNPNLLSTLHKRYGAEIFVFINQLDLKNHAQSNNQAALGNYDRLAGVHYSIYDLQGNLLNAGLVTKNFPTNVNDPKKIVNHCFNEIAQTILEKYLAATTPKTDKDKGTLKWVSPEKKGN